ncbi:MAG: hypothetical protein U0V75_06775 [Ferruginibacter sp.]
MQLAEISLSSHTCPKPFVVGCAILVYLLHESISSHSQNSNELKFVTDLLRKLGVGSSTVTQEELEDIGMSKLMRQVDKTKRASRVEIMKKLSA